MFQNLKIVDTYIVGGIQNLHQLTIFNPVYIEIGESPNFMEFARKYPSTRYVYRFKLNSITFSSNITNTDKEILITITGLSNCKKSDTNGEQDSILSIMHIEKRKLGTVVQYFKLDKHRSERLFRRPGSAKHVLQFYNGINPRIGKVRRRT